MSGFKPKIVGFLCNWCSYAGADSAGNRKMTYPAEFEVVRIMCSGRADPQLVLKAFSEGADGVAVFGCHPGDCHYKEGNYKAFTRYHLLRKLLPDLGIPAERLRLEWISASEAGRFVEAVKEFHARLVAMGPLHANKKDREAGNG